MTVHAPDTLTHVELIWLEKRIEHWIRFGHDIAEKILDRRRRILRFAPDSVFAFVRWAANDSARSSRASTSCALSDLARPIRRWPMCAPAAKFSCASPAGPRSSACCRRSTPSNSSASIRPTPVPITGAISRTGSRPVMHRAPTRASAIAPGFCAGGSRHDALRLGLDDVFRGGRIALSPLFHQVPKLVWNASASVPIGLYAVRPTGTLHIAELVVVTPPEPLARFLDERRYLPKGVPLLKRVLALPGQTVCRAPTARSPSTVSRWERRSTAIGGADLCPSGRAVASSPPAMSS